MFLSSPFTKYITVSANLVCEHSGPEVNIKNRSLTQLSMASIMLINIKMTTVVGILTFVCMINTTAESLEAGT